MKLIYIAGPYRAATEWAVVQNIRAAEALAVEVWRAGAVAVCPHKDSGLLAGIVPDDVFLAGDLEILQRCDAVVTTADWQASTGARGEVHEARRLGLPVFDSVGLLAEWLDDPHAPAFRFGQRAMREEAAASLLAVRAV